MSEEGKTADGLGLAWRQRYEGLFYRAPRDLVIDVAEAEPSRMEVGGRRLTPAELVRVLLHQPFEIHWVEDLRALVARLVPMGAR